MYVFHCRACGRAGYFESFADANRFAGWTHVGKSLICGRCYLVRLAAKVSGLPDPRDDEAWLRAGEAAKSGRLLIGAVRAAGQEER